MRATQRSDRNAVPRAPSPPRPRPGLWGAALLLLLAAAPAAAQTGTIRGTVVDATTRRPLAGAQVFIPNAGVGTITNAQGAFLLVNAPAGQRTVRAQMIGYGTSNENVTVAPGQTATVNFELGQSAIALDEIVVTGSGVATEKRKLGNTVATIDAVRLEDKPINNVSEVLAGREPGVSVLPAGGLTGEGARIRIRGTNSLSQSNEPIIYLNGVRVDRGGGRGNIATGGGGLPSRLDDIDPSSIERIEVLKGAAAATLYGSEASSGVIQIFTKRGTAGETRWNVEIEQGAVRYPDVFEPNAGFVRTAADAQRLSQFYGTDIQPYQPFSRDFTSSLFETGYSSVYGLSVSGGAEKLTYYASGRYQYEDGPIAGETFGARGTDDATRAQGTVSLTLNPVETVTLRVNSLYTQSESNTINNNNNIYAPVTLALFGQPQRATCTTARGQSEPTGSGGCTGQGNPLGQAAFATVRETLQRAIAQNVEHFNGSLSAGYRPMVGLSLDANVGIDMVNQRDEVSVPFGYDLDGFTTNNITGQREISDRNFRQFSADARGSWDTPFSEVISSQFVAGTQLSVQRVDITGGSGRDFPGPGFNVAEAGLVQTVAEEFSSIVNLGFLAQEQIGLYDWIFATVGGRYDYNSAFGESAGGAFYPKVSLSVIPSDRPGWNQPLGMTSLRFRGALGKSGLQPGAFDQLTTFAAIRAEAAAGVQPSNLGNPDLRPEVSTEWEVGAEMGLLQDRLGLEVTYWDRTVDDALISRQFPVSGGFLNRQLVNIGQLESSGVEIGLRGVAVQTRNVAINLFANAAYLKENVADLGGAPPLKVGGSYTRYRNWIREGAAPGAFFGPKILDVEYPIDINNDCKADSREALLAYFAKPIESLSTTGPFRVLVEGGDPRPCGGGGDFLGHYLGKPTPDWSGAFGGNMTFLRDFELSTLFEYKAGNYQVHNLTNGFRTAHPSLGGNLPGAVQAQATLANPNATAEQRLEAARQWVTENVALSPYDGLGEIEDADFVRWRELSLTYNVPVAMAERLGGRTLSLSLGARNVALWTKYGGADPEVNLLGRTTDGGLDDFAQGIDAFGLPLPRRITASVRMGF